MVAKNTKVCYNSHKNYIFDTLMAKEKSNKKRIITFPVYCDFSCEYADFSNPDASGACRRDLSVWCRHFNRYNNKHNKCFGKI